jgi:hypothetical protein
VPTRRPTPRELTVPKAFAPVAAAFAKKRGVTCEEGWGEGNVTLKLRGKIFVMIVRDQLVAKLPRTRVDALVDEKTGVRFDPRKNGRVMKEWLVVTAKKADWIALATEAFDYAKA